MYTYYFSDGNDGVRIINVDFEGEPLREMRVPLSEYENDKEHEQLKDPKKILVYPDVYTSPPEDEDAIDLSLKAKEPYVIGLEEDVTETFKKFDIDDWSDFFEAHEIKSYVSKMDTLHVYH